MLTSLQRVLVHLDSTSATPGRLALARAIAGRHQSALTALYAVTPAVMAVPSAPELAAELSADLFALDEARRASTLKAFDQAMSRPGIMAAWAETSEFPVAGAFAQQARFADLVVLGQQQPGQGWGPAVPPDFPESVLAASGRPGVIVPYIGCTRPVGRTVAIAWKETPEAARAVAGAMPFLQRAEQVHVLTWGAEAEPPKIGGQALDLEGYLGLHAVKPTWHREGQEPHDLGEILLSRAFDLGADLLVMGCYGHGRAREWILGGVTRTVLASMTLPVLMAH